MVKPIIAIKTSTRDYSGLVELGNRVASSLTGNLNFPSPSPAVMVLETAVTAVENAIAAWGPKGNRGARESLYDLRAKAITLAQTLKSEAQYVQNAAQTAAGSDYAQMASILSTSGFSLAKTREDQGLLQPVENFRRMVVPSLDADKCKLKWKKPLNVTTRNNVKEYLVFRGTTSVFSAAVQIAVASKSEFIDTNTTGAVVTYFYFVCANSSAGIGAVSAPLMVTMLAI